MQLCRVRRFPCYAISVLLILIIISCAAQMGVGGSEENSGIVPNAPDSLQVKSQSPCMVEITWLDRSDNEKSFIIERVTGNNTNWESVGSIATGKPCRWFDKSVDTQISYRYRVYAQNKAGISSYAISDTVTAINDPSLDSIASILVGTWEYRAATSCDTNEAPGYWQANMVIEGVQSANCQITFSGYLLYPNQPCQKRPFSNALVLANDSIYFVASSTLENPDCYSSHRGIITNIGNVYEMGGRYNWTDPLQCPWKRNWFARKQQ
ncbi:MAG: fibronectin type III domain-containing protein [Candidatus Zixiibacteriota bacterium]